MGRKSYYIGQYLMYNNMTYIIENIEYDLVLDTKIIKSYSDVLTLKCFDNNGIYTFQRHDLDTFKDISLFKKLEYLAKI